MDNLSVEFPYSVGTYLLKEEDGVKHIDQLYEYIINEKGVFVIVMLDALTNPRLSTRIDLDNFVNNWTKVEDSINKLHIK